MAIRNIKQQIRTASGGNVQPTGRTLTKVVKAKAVHQVKRPIKYISGGINNKISHANLKITSYHSLANKTYSSTVRPVKDFLTSSNKKEIISNSISNTKNALIDKKNNIKDIIADNTPSKLKDKALHSARNSQLVRNVYDRPKRKINDISEGISNLKNDANKLSAIVKNNGGLKRAISNKENSFANSGMNSKLGRRISNTGGALNSGVNKLRDTKNNISGKVSDSIKKDGYLKTGQNALAAAKKGVSTAAAQKYTKTAEKLSGLGMYLKVAITLILTIVLAVEIFAAMMGIAIVVAKTPHYYCDLNASKEEKKTEIYQRYCGGAAAGNETIAQAAVSLAYDPNNETATRNTEVNCDSNPKDPTATECYKYIHDEVMKDHPTLYASCDVGATTAIRWAGADDEFGNLGMRCDNLIEYMETHSDIWEDLGEFSDVSQLEPGDVILHDWHIEIYVGNEAVQEKFPGTDYDCVAASIGDYAPRVKKVNPNYCLDGVTKTYHIYRNITPEADSIFKDVIYNE